MKRRFAFTFFGPVLLLIGLFSVGTAQQFTSLAEVATGEGTLKSDNGDKHCIKAVAVFLRKNSEAEIWLMTERENVFAGGRWFRGGDASREIGLEITNDTEGGCASGSGTISLQAGLVPVAKLTMTMTRADGTRFEVGFTSRNPRSWPNP